MKLHVAKIEAIKVLTLFIKAITLLILKKISSRFKLV